MVRRGGDPVWLVFDSRHRRRYPFQGALPGNTPAWMLESGLLKVEQAPFYAARIHVGDLGTKGGYVTDTDAQVLDLHGKPIAALYAAGNVTAPVVGKSYPGPGITLGLAMTFAYLAADRASRRRTNS